MTDTSQALQTGPRLRTVVAAMGIIAAIVVGFLVAEVVSAQFDDKPDTLATDAEREAAAPASKAELDANLTDRRIDAWERDGAVEPIAEVSFDAVASSLEVTSRELIPGSKLFSTDTENQDDGDGNVTTFQRFEYVADDGRIVHAFWQEVIPEWDFTLKDYGRGDYTVDSDGIETLVMRFSVSVQVQVYDPNTGILTAVTIEGGLGRPEALDGVDMAAVTTDLRASARASER